MREFISRLRIFYVDVPALRPGTIGAYLLSFVSVGVATALRLAIDPYVEGLQFATFIVAVTLTTLISGFGAGLFSVVLSIVAFAVFVLPPHLSFYIEQPGDVLALLLYTVVMLFNVALITGMRVAVERQRDQRALQETKDRLQSTLDAARLGSWRYDARNPVISWDARSKEIFGVPEDGAIIEEFMNWVHPDDEEKVWAAYYRALDPAQPERSLTQFRLRQGDGKVRWVETQGLAHLEGAGRERQVVGFIGTVQDITARKSAEEAQARLAAIVTSSADAIVGKTLDGVVTNWNEAAERMFGYSAAEMIGQSIRRVIPSDRQAEEDMILSRIAQSESVERYEMMLLAKDGRTFDASITISPIRDAEGRNIGCSKIIRDITPQKQVQAVLRRQADLLDQSHDAIFTWKIGGGITYWNRGAEVLYGYTAEEALGRSSHELLRTLSPTPMEEIEVQIARGGSWYGELSHTTREGRVVVVESRHVGVCYDGETYTLETNRDITARRRAEKQVGLLMREATHRAKNMLSLVQAIARQTAAREPDEFVGRFTERIQALAANQDLLVRNEWHGVDVEDLVRAQLAHFADLMGSRIAAHGPKLRLNAAAAQAIGLAMHELATNASKYGALSTDRGHVNLHWETDGDTLSMSWTERGGPPVSLPEQRGFGTVVMQEMIKHSLDDGSVDLDYAPAGLSWRLTCPAANALEPPRA
jgi:PAS domain S-box-containing protein